MQHLYRLSHSATPPPDSGIYWHRGTFSFLASKNPPAPESTSAAMANCQLLATYS